MKFHTSTDISTLVADVEKARFDMGRGFFLYRLREDGIQVVDRALTDTGRRNLAAHVRDHINLGVWNVRPSSNGVTITSKRKTP